LKHITVQFLKGAVSKHVDYLIMKGLLVFPSREDWHENGVWQSPFKNGTEFSNIIARAVEMELDDYIKGMEEKETEKQDEKENPPDTLWDEPIEHDD
jgi:hypothetical protein